VTGSGGPRRRALAALCVTEIVSYGGLYYAFPVLAGDIARSTGWSRPAVTAAFSAASLTSALAGIPVGRLTDARGPRTVMTAGSVLAVLALAGIAVAPGYWWFLAAWLLAGTAMTGVLYPPAFAALTAWYGPDRVRALTTLTLAAGFSSTIFAPLTAALTGHLGWRGTYLALAGITGALTIPAHAVTLRLPWPPRAGPLPASRGAATDPAVRHVLASRQFAVLAAAMSLSGFALYAVAVNLVPLLTGRGMSPAAAAWTLGLTGAGQVAGRLCYRLLADHSGPAGRLVVIFAFGSGSVMLLAVIAGPAPILIMAAVLAGAARGLFTLLQATAVSDRWGPAGYASISAVLAAPVTIAIALAPAAGAAIASGLGGYPAMFTVLAAIGAASAALAIGSGPAKPHVP
jgi:MFS family permease